MVIAPPGDVLEYFRSIAAEPWQIKGALRTAMDPPCPHAWEGIIITPRVRKIFKDLAQACPGDARVAPADIIRSIVADGGGVAARVLAKWTARAPMTQPPGASARP